MSGNYQIKWVLTILNYRSADKENGSCDICQHSNKLT